jgi:hypothetical protein
MTVVPRPFPPAMPHGELREVFPNLYFVTGTTRLPMGVPIRFSRNMTVVRESDRLVLVNTMRLDDAGLAALDKLGKVTDIIRLAGNHGADDPFYADRYQAKVWVVRGQRYTAGFDTNAATTYFAPHGELDVESPLPIAGAKLHVIHSRPPEALLVLERAGGVCISGDCFQHWERPDAYFNWLAKPMMRMMGFLKPHNIGPGWLKQCKPPADELAATLDLPFDHVLPAHGEPVIGEARTKYRAAVARATGKPAGA